MPLYRRLPKRGFKSLKTNNTAILNLSKIQEILDKKQNDLKTVIDLKILKNKKLISQNYSKLKILGSGELKTNIQITANFASKQAMQKIEKVGGKLNLIKK